MVKWDYEDDEEESQTNWQQNSLVLICAVMIVGLGWLFASNRLPTGNKKPVSPSGRMFVVPAAKKRGWRTPEPGIGALGPAAAKADRAAVRAVRTWLVNRPDSLDASSLSPGDYPWWHAGRYFRMA